MANDSNPRIEIELEAGADPIRGSIEQAGGRKQRFWGWLELIDAVRRVASAKSDGPRDAAARLGATPRSSERFRFTQAPKSTGTRRGRGRTK